jgi:hypothetical protein
MDKNTPQYNIINEIKSNFVIIHGVCGFEEYLQKQKEIQKEIQKEKEKEKEKGLTFDDNVFGNNSK